MARLEHINGAQIITFAAMFKSPRISLLIIASVITLLTLLCIQVYLVTNTYKLYQNSFIQESREKINSVTKLPEMEQLKNLMQDNLKSQITKYVTKTLARNEIFSGLKSANKRAGERYGQRLKDLLKGKMEVDSIKYSERYEEIIIVWEGKVDTLLGSKDKPFDVIGSGDLAKNALISNRNAWNVTLGITDERYPVNEKELTISLRQSNYFVPVNANTIIYRKMTGILVLASLLITAIVGIFYVIFHTMMTQKNLAAMKTDFANNITHELKTPLSSVTVILKSMRKIDMKTQPKIMEELIDSMDRQYGKIKRMIDNVLESTVSDISLALEEVDIASFLHKFAEDLWLDEHEFRVEIEPRQQLVAINEPALLRILNILIDNAVKYSPAGSPITLKAFATQRIYHIQVLDRGPGIDPTYHKAVFDKFFRVPGHDYYGVKGLGLGLFIAKETAIKINGSLLTRNVHPQGAEFSLELPI